MRSSIDLTAFERALWQARGDMQTGVYHAPLICRFLSDAITLMNLGGLPVLELTEPIAPGLVNAGWQLYFNRLLPMERNNLALISQPVADWQLRRSWTLVSSAGDDRASILLEFGEAEAGTTARSHVLVCGAILPANPGNAVRPLLTPDVVAAIEGGASPEMLAGIEDQSRRAANRAIGAIWTHFVSDIEIGMPSNAEIISARNRNRTSCTPWHRVQISTAFPASPTAIHALALAGAEITGTSVKKLEKAIAGLKEHESATVRGVRITHTMVNGRREIDVFSTAAMESYFASQDRGAD